MTLTHSSATTDIEKGKIHDEEVRAFIATLKARDPEIKVLMAIGGWDVGVPSKGNYAEFIKEKNVETFAIKIVERLKELTFDGFDLEAGDVPHTINNLPNALSPKLKERDLLMTAAFFSLFDKFYPKFSKESLSKLDFINVMSYNYGLASNTIAPTNCASLADFDREARYWLGRDVPHKKIVMGVPYYSHLWELDGIRKISSCQPTYGDVYRKYLLPNNATDYYKNNIEKIYSVKNEKGYTVSVDCKRQY